MEPIARRRRNRMDLLSQVDRHLPITFSIVGVQKAATSTLYRMLVQHPEVVGGPEKEMRFFLDEGRDWDDPDYSEYVRPARGRRARIAGDATPAYFFWPRALERMQRYRPQMRLVLSVRDPIERAMSQWSMQRDRDPRFPDVPEAIERFAADRIPEDVPSGTKDYDLRRTSLFTRGLYGQQLRRGLGLFPREQWSILDFRSITGDAQATLDRLTEFLDISSFPVPAKALHRNLTRSDHTGAPLTGADVRRLVDVYADDLAAFSRMSGLDVAGWSTTRVAAGELTAEELATRLSRKLGLVS